MAPGFAPQESSARRIGGLDLARALAVTAMVLGHTAHGLLSDSARQVGWVQVYWSFRGLTAPLFLFVSGWAIITAIHRSGAKGSNVVRDRLPRVLLLLGIGVALRWPYNGIYAFFSDEPGALNNVLGFDALQCIALSLFAAALLVSRFDSPKWRALMLGVAAVLVVPLSVVTARWAAENPLPLLLSSAVASSPSSPFPVVPWASYFFAGGAVGQVILLARTPLQRVLVLVIPCAALVTWTHFVPALPVSDLSIALIPQRLGLVMGIAAIACAAPAALGRMAAPLGRATLVIYAFHIPVVYGWAGVSGLSWRHGHILGVLDSITLGLALLITGFLLDRALKTGWRSLTEWMARQRATGEVTLP